MKRIIKSIEAIPLHLTVGIVRLDDALGESWGLPIQACGDWDSFHNMLKSVVFANGRAGAQKVLNEQFVITLSKTGQQVTRWDWEKTITEGAHIEQAMIVSRDASSDRGRRCLRPGCNGTVVNGVGNRSNTKSCLRCSQLAISQKKAVPVLDFMAVEGWVESSAGDQATLENTGRPKQIGPEPMPRIQVDDENIRSFHRVCTIEPLERIQDISEACARLAIDDTDAAANRCVGLHLLQNNEEGIPAHLQADPIPYLRAAAQLGNSLDAETWYLLARAYLDKDNIAEAYDALQQAVYGAGRSPSMWITVGILYIRISQYRDCLDALSRSIRLNDRIWQAWFNLGVLYDSYGQYEDSHDSFRRCLELKADLPDVTARMRVLEDFGLKNVPDDSRLVDMRDCELRTVWEMRHTHSNSGSGRDEAADGINVLYTPSIAVHTDGSESDSLIASEEEIVFRKAVHFDNANIAWTQSVESLGDWKE